MIKQMLALQNLFLNPFGTIWKEWGPLLIYLWYFSETSSVSMSYVGLCFICQPTQYVQIYQWQVLHTHKGSEGFESQYGTYYGPTKCNQHSKKHAYQKLLQHNSYHQAPFLSKSMAGDHFFLSMVSVVSCLK